jgi:hypothetical protein
MVRSVTGLFFLTSIAAFAQAADPPAFEVASIRPGQPGKEVIEHVPGSLSMRNARLTACIRWAYGLQDYQVSGPGWVSDAPPGTPESSGART